MCIASKLLDRRREPCYSDLSLTMSHKKGNAKRPVCIFCARSEGVQFAIFNPKFPPFGTACVECEAKHERLPGWTPEQTAEAHRILTSRLDRETAVSTYCRAFQISGRSPAAFARLAQAFAPDLCLAVRETIGSWPSSEIELAALQRQP